jgi:DNA-binding transcriptional regulator GbsR (MarR family)
MNDDTGEGSPVTPEELRYVEDVGGYMESLGSTRMAGRVWGTLLISEEPELSAPELGERLGTSAGSISTATRALLALGMVERRRRPGDRKDYFAIRPDSYLTLIRRREHVIELFTDLVRRGLDIVGDAELPRRRLTEFDEFYTWLSERFHGLIEEWYRERPSRSEHK